MTQLPVISKNIIDILTKIFKVGVFIYDKLKIFSTQKVPSYCQSIIIGLNYLYQIAKESHPIVKIVVLTIAFYIVRKIRKIINSKKPDPTKKQEQIDFQSLGTQFDVRSQKSIQKGKEHSHENDDSCYLEFTKNLNRQAQTQTNEDIHTQKNIRIQKQDSVFFELMQSYRQIKEESEDQR